MNPATRVMLSKAATWSAQIWLSMAFIGAGYAKITVVHEHLVLLLGWPTLMPVYLVRGVGVAEILLGFALVANLIVMPSARQPAMAALVVSGLVAAFMGVVHLASLDFGLAFVNGVLLVLSVIALNGYLSDWARKRAGLTALPPILARRALFPSPSLRREVRPRQRLQSDRDRD